MECINIEILYKTNKYSRNRHLLDLVCITYGSAFSQSRKLVHFFFNHFGFLFLCICMYFVYSVYYLKVKYTRSLIRVQKFLSWLTDYLIVLNVQSQRYI